jgi:hypothetical protein
MLALLPQVDAYIKRATGRDWTVDSTIHPLAKSAAEMLLVKWYENPAMYGNGVTSLDHGLTAVLGQLETIALQYVHFEGLSGAGYIEVPGVYRGDTVVSVTGVTGITGNQAASFETVITVDGYIQQTSATDLTDKWFRAYVTKPSEQ